MGKLRKLVTLDTDEEKVSGLKDDVDKPSQNSSQRDTGLKNLGEWLKSWRTAWDFYLIRTLDQNKKKRKETTRKNKMAEKQF